jgi:peptidyl-prolyl cis-trans isomerase A (cyclophilin A)
MLKKLPLIGALFAAVTFSMTDDVAAAGSPQVLMKTSKGEVLIELYPDKAPRTVENFLQYVRDGFYAGTVFHRVIDRFMIQGGGFTEEMYKGGSGRKNTRGPIALESKNGLKNDTGWLAMARTSVPDSATSQFFINVTDNSSLNHPQPDGHGYAVFGKVIRGMEVVNAIKGVKTRNIGPMGDVPVEPVVIESMTVVNPAQ